MRLPGVKLTQRWLRRAHSRLAGGIAVLGYHRVFDASRDPLRLTVSPGHFAEQLEILAHAAHVVRLSDAVAALTQGTMPRRTVVLTFDDGYRDTLDEALPIIERLGMAVTVFVSTGSPGKEFWWDELTRILMDAPRLPNVLALEIGGRKRSWSLESFDGPGSIEERQHLIRALAGEVRRLGRTERETILDAVRTWASAQDAPASSTVRALTIEELRRLAASASVEIGAHSVTHPVLTMLTREEQREEICRSRAELRRITGMPVTSFSYPHGAYSPDTIIAVNEAGFRTACCSEPDVIRRGAHKLTLPRLWVQDQDARSFARWLGSWGLIDR